MSIVLETRGLTKRFGSCTSFEGVSLAFESGRIHAVLGENGAGKSSLMKVLFGLYAPTEGSIRLEGEEVVWRSSMDAIKRGLGMVQQHFSLVDNLSAIDNIMLGAEICKFAGRLDRKSAIAKLKKLLPSAHLAVPWNELVENLTVGEKQRVEILKLLFREAKVLFLDEPTAVLAPSEIEDFFSVLRYLKASGKTIVVITHKINEVFQLCDTYTVLRQGRLVTSGEVKEASTDLIVEAMIGRQLPSLDVQRPAPRSETFLECDSLSESTYSLGSLNGVSLKLQSGEIVGVAGIDGSGQGHLVEAIMGLRPFSGRMKILGREMQPLQTSVVRSLGVGLVPDDRQSQGLWLEESCFDNMIIGLEDRFLRRHVFDRELIETTTTEWAKDFDVRTNSLETPVLDLSGGNQQKVILAREVSGRTPRLLICHQPTRGVDLGAIDLIYRRLLKLRNEGLGILILSSELDELIELCDRIYVFFEGRVTAELRRDQFDTFVIGKAMTGAMSGK